MGKLRRIVVPVILACAIAAPTLANKLTGSNNQHSSYHDHTGTHDSTANKKITAFVSCSETGWNFPWYVSWEEAGLAGKTDKAGTIKTEHDEKRKLKIISGMVKAWKSKPAQLWFAADATWANNVHKPKEDKETSSVADDTDESQCRVETEDGNDAPAVVVASSSMATAAGERQYTYSIDNQSQEAITFSWPGVRTTAHPNGWGGTVAANSSVTITQTTPDTAEAYYTRSGVQIEGATFDATFPGVAAVSESYLTFPAAVANLGGSRVGAGIVLAWTNNGSYDRIQIVRNDEVLFEVDGDDQTFADDEPEPGPNTYDVIAIADHAGSLQVSTIVE